MKMTGLILITCLVILSCRSDQFFSERKYYGGKDMIEFGYDHSYRHYLRSETFISQFSQGEWRQNGNSLILFNKVLNPSELPISIKAFPSEELGTELFINISPKKNTDWEIEQDVIDVINIDFIVKDHVYPVKNMINIINLKEPLNGAYFRAYPKLNSLHICEVLNDTLYSKPLNLIGQEISKSNLAVEIDCNPLYFAQVKMPNDTIRIINTHKIKWNKINLERQR